MAIVQADIQSRLSGGTSNTDPAAALGDPISSTAITDATPGNLFPEVDEDQTTAGVTLYRCFYVRNGHGSLTYKNVKAYIQTQTPSPDTAVAIALGSSAVNGTEQTIANEETAPSSVTFSAPADKASGLSIGDIPAGEHKAIWVRLTVDPGAAAYADSCVIRTAGGTAA